MTELRRRSLAAIALVSLVLSWSGLRVWARFDASGPPLTWTPVLVMVVVSGAVLAAGWPVRQWTRGRRERPLNPLLAARTLVLARACAYTGALLIGWYGAQALSILPELDLPSRGDRLLVAGASVLASGLLLVAGLVVERYCRIPPDDDDRPPGAPPADLSA